jgi:hypothetical protein
MSTHDLLSRLRGAHKPEEPGARGIEGLARNPACLLLRALTITGFKPSTAAKILGIPPKEGQSPFALAMGIRFDSSMLRSGAAALFTLYRQNELLAAQEAKIVSIEEYSPGPKPQALRRREIETARVLDAKRRGDSSAPNIIIKPRLPVFLAGVPHAIEPDYLVASDSEPFYRVGELKSYPDRGGKTDPADVRSACRQAAVGIVALRQFLQAAGHRNPAVMAPPNVDLVLRVTGLFMPSLRRMSAHGEVDSVERAINDASASLEELEAMLSADASLNDPAVIASLPNNYRSSCKEHCGLWESCKARALQARAPTLLGDHAAELLGPAASIDRAVELMTGQGAPPHNAAEQALADELRTADQAFRQVVASG